MEMFCSVKFSKENDYYIMSMSCFIEVSNDITKLKQYDDIEKKINHCKSLYQKEN